MDALLALASEHGVPLVEDAAQAIGARDASGRRIGGRGRVACFSFYPTKNLGGAGEGGFLSTDDADLAERLRRLARARLEPSLCARGTRHELAPRCAASRVLRVKLRRLDAWNEARHRHAAAYDEAFARARRAAEHGAARSRRSAAADTCAAPASRRSTCITST